MTASDLYNDKILIENFGKSRVFEVCRHLRTIWPDFPRYEQKINNYHLSWIVFILSKSMNSTEKDVQKAILEGRELECEGQPFITFFGDLLFDYDRIESEINSIFIYYQGDNAVHAHHHHVTKMFQGQTRANNVMRCAILEKEFLLQLSEMLHPYQDENLQAPEFQFDEKLHPDSRRKNSNV